MSTPTATPARTAIEAARARIAKEQAKLAELEAKAAARENLSERYRGGMSINDLAEEAGVTIDTMRSMLVEVGAIAVRKRKLDEADIALATMALQKGESVPLVAERLNFAEATVRRIAQAIGVSQRAPVRSAKQMAELVALEDQMRKLYGAGFAALGEALRKYRKSLGQVPSSEQVAEEENVLNDEPLLAGQPVPAAVGAPPVLSPEDEARMAEPDEAPWA